MASHKFKVEKVKWKWAEKVQSKDVYRDDEFVRSKTKEEALEAVHYLMGQPKGLTYTITVLRDGEYLTYWRHSMPCLGGLVKYRDSHGDKHFMNPYFPRDIRVPFPEGDITFIACQKNRALDLKSPYWDFIFSQESPWVDAFGSKDTIVFKDSHFVLTNMNTDPTVFYSLMRQGGLAHGSPSQYKKWDPRAALLAEKVGPVGQGQQQADPRRLAGQWPIRISGGTWAEGFGYTRPYNESIFKTSVPTIFNDFRKLAGYPQSSCTNDFFRATMKEMFGIDVSKGIQADSKCEKALTEAWEYFKQHAPDLCDLPGCCG